MLTGFDESLLTPVVLKTAESFQPMDFDTHGMNADALDDVPLRVAPDLSQPLDGLAPMGDAGNFYQVVNPVVAKGLSSVGRRSYRPVMEFPFEQARATIGLQNDKMSDLTIEDVTVVTGAPVATHSKGLVELSGVVRDALFSVGVLVGGTWVYFNLRFV